jgi:hypothetical protein
MSVQDPLNLSQETPVPPNHIEREKTEFSDTSETENSKLPLIVIISIFIFLATSIWLTR